MCTDMISYENKVFVAGLLATAVALVLLVIVEELVGFPGDWATVLAFLIVVVLGFVLPQLHLIRVDPSVSRTARLGVISLILIVLGAGFSNTLSGTELYTVWAVVGVSIAVMFVSEVIEGYRESAPKKA